MPPSVFEDGLLETFRVVHGVPDGCKGDFRYKLGRRLIAYTHSGKDRNLGHYVELLRRQEKGKYDRQGCLLPETLLGDDRPRDLRVPGIRVLHPRCGNSRAGPGSGRRRRSFEPAPLREEP